MGFKALRGLETKWVVFILNISISPLYRFAAPISYPFVFCGCKYRLVLLIQWRDKGAKVGGLTTSSCPKAALYVCDRRREDYSRD
ncbi:hypothetical protein HMPREF1545_01010 [Oscillibacter sp. KLE 1728]|nr:hypothetical protein HMPREF1545_01010 [Oscillibacter sp. KLE 1728]